ncbi:MAG: hypothetical protein ABJA60_07910 [Nitrosospira sp.]
MSTYPETRSATPAGQQTPTWKTRRFSIRALHTSIFESTAVQQTTGTSAVSTVKLIDIAIQNNNKIYNATSGNYATGTNIQSLLIACSAPQKAIFQGYVNASFRVIMPLIAI